MKTIGQVETIVLGRAGLLLLILPPLPSCTSPSIHVETYGGSCSEYDKWMSITLPSFYLWKFIRQHTPPPGARAGWEGRHIHVPTVSALWTLINIDFPVCFADCLLYGVKNVLLMWAGEREWIWSEWNVYFQSDVGSRTGKSRSYNFRSAQASEFQVH